MHTRVLALVLIATTPVALATATDSASGAPASPTAAAAPSAQKAAQKGEQTYRAGRYIVSFTDEPLATYNGSKKGFAATRPAADGKLNANSAGVEQVAEPPHRRGTTPPSPRSARRRSMTTP